MSALPAYRVKVSARAKYARLQMSLREGLVVIVPRRFDQKRVPELLREKERWIERTAAKIAQQRKLLEAAPPDHLPERLALCAIGEEWAVEYVPTDLPHVAAVEREACRLLVYGQTSDARACKRVLRRWLSRKAQEHLVPWLHETAGERGFRFDRAVVKAQRTRWASCSQSGTISLNLKLLFLPEALVRHVLIHELCHTVQPNHSRHFWALVGQHDPEFRQANRDLRAGWRHVPAWMESEKMLPEV